MDFKALFTQLSVVFTKLSKQQKIIIVVAIVGIVSFLVFLVVYTTSKDSSNKYEVLFDKLSSSDAAKVIEQLEKDNVPYELLADNVIKVPKDRVYKERITIASMGIPKDGGVGFELFDTQEFGATSFDQKIKHLRALEGELSRTINALSPIEHSSVSLALPKETLFVSKETPPTASVMVTLREDRRLSAKQIRGIKNLVASAVPKLTPTNVTLVNQDGETLGDDDEMAQMGELSVVQQKYKTKEEKKKQKKIVEIISPFVGGPTKVIAQVSIEYDFSVKNSTSESFDPENVVRSEQISEEKREGGVKEQVGGVPGAVSNIGPVQGIKENTPTEKYEKNTGTTNYEVGKTIQTTKSQFATIRRITAAVLVDGKYSSKLDESGEPTDQQEYKALDETDLQALSSLVSQAIGIDETRGDTISVKNLQFKRKVVTKTEDQLVAVRTFVDVYISPFADIFKYLFVIILLIIAYKKIITPFAERMLEVTEIDEDLEAPKLELEDDEDDDLIEKVQAMRKKVEEQLGVSDGFNEDEMKYDVLLEKVKSMTHENPEGVAAILEALLSEEADGFSR